jgi:hypothetical protein
MTRSQFGLLVDRAWRQGPSWFRGPADRPPGPGVARRLGGRLGAVLPPDYIWFVCEYGGGRFGRAVVYSADEISDRYICRNQPVPFRRDFVAVAGAGVNRYVGFPLTGGVCPDRIIALDARLDRLEPTAYPGFLAYLAAAALPW